MWLQASKSNFFGIFLTYVVGKNKPYGYRVVYKKW